jgi:hypothetical protein
MRQIIGTLVALAVVCTCGISQAAEPIKKASTAEAPLALQALNVAPSQVLSQHQAEQVRGQWWISLPLRSGSVYFQGIGSPFRLYVVTESGTVPGVNVGLRVTIGR